MSMYKCKCKKCNHTFYDIKTPCRDSVNPTCPMCKSKNVNKTQMKKPNGAKWAEDVGCKHKKCQKYGLKGH